MFKVFHIFHFVVQIQKYKNTIQINTAYFGMRYTCDLNSKLIVFWKEVLKNIEEGSQMILPYGIHGMNLQCFRGFKIRNACTDYSYSLRTN